ncbi:unnamed protein product [Spodoptera exigua]|nr:unnamed protein product [Spodoptera exigua]
MGIRNYSDPEKRNLLMEQKEDKKRRQYSGSRSKTDRVSLDVVTSWKDSQNLEPAGRKQQIYDSQTPITKPPAKRESLTSTILRERPLFSSVRIVADDDDYKEDINDGDANGAFNFRGPVSQAVQSNPYQSEKKESWWFWNNKEDKEIEKEKPKKSASNDETCSCVSCALRKIVSSEYACIGCLVVLFLISVIVAYFIVCKSVPGMVSDDCKDKGVSTTLPPITDCNAADSERLKRKIEMLNGNRLKNEYPGLNEYGKDIQSGADQAQLMAPVHEHDTYISIAQLNHNIGN